ncbi:MAG: hypothetical protein ABIP48_25180 [Planctomycetota bacterium]
MTARNLWNALGPGILLAAATGHHLVDGYARVPGPKNWAPPST